ALAGGRGEQIRHAIGKLRVDVVVGGREPVRAQARRRPGERLGAALGGRPGLIPGVGQHEERRRLEGGVAGGRTMLPERADDLEVAVTGEARLDPPVLADPDAMQRGGDGPVRELWTLRAHARLDLGEGEVVEAWRRERG